jgi:class 3 adenylate cyclase/tetratricopeptide (TPR) repeat protein
VAETPALDNLEGERKTVTTLFADIKGSMDLEEGIDPEKARAIVDPALQLMMEAVHHYDGYVAQSTGDGIFALFGAPVAHEDDPQRALHAALRMQEDLHRYSTKLRESGNAAIEARVGVHTGEVVVRSIQTAEGRSEYVPVGHPVGLAARMQALAPPGSIAATETTRKLCEGFFNFRSLGPSRVKGVSEAVDIYEVTGVGALRTRLERSAARGLTPFIGRDDEMRMLWSRWEAAREGEGQVVLIAGEAGIGKSRVVHQFHERLAGTSHRWVEGDAEPYFQNTPFHAVVPIVNQAFGLSADQTPGESLDRLETELQQNGINPSEAVVPIAQILNLSLGERYRGSTLSPEQGRKRLLGTLVKTLFAIAASQPPMVLAIEDLHWADASTLEFLQLLVEQAATAPVMVLLTCRPEFEAPWPTRAHHAQITLGRLRDRQVREMVAAVAAKAALTDQAIEAVTSRASGIPLFIEELTRVVLERGSSEAVPGIPETLQNSLIARLDRLGAAKEAAQVASVIGREFSYDLLSAVVPMREDVLQSSLMKLADAELIYTRGMAPDARYIFKHALIRDAAYETLLKSRRKELHGRVAQAIEAVHERNLEPHVSALAHHYRTAGAAADRQKAIDYSIRAGSAAYALFAYEEAGAHWRAALEVMDEQGGGDRRRRADLLWLLGDELVSGGAKSVQYLEAAAQLFEELGDSKAACDVHSRLGLYLSATNIGMDVRRAMPHYKKAETFLATQPESARHALFYIHLAAACIATSRICDGLAAGKRAMEISERLDLDVLWPSAAVLTSVLLISSGSVTEGLQLAHEARRRADPISDTVTGSTPAWVGGANYLRLGDPREAQEWSAHELAKPRTARSAIRRAILHNQLAGACRDMGELPKARAYLAEAHAENEALPLFAVEASLLFLEGQWELADKMLTAQAERARTSGNRQDECWVAFRLARLHRFRGESSRAVQFLQTALEISVDSGDVLLELRTRSELATMAADTGDPVEAVPHLQRFRQIVAAGENWFGLTGSVERAEAVVAEAQGEYSVSEASFEKAIAIFQRYCLPWEEADTLQYWGRALLAAGELARAIEKFDAAIEIYRSRGAGKRFIEYVMADKRRAQVSK